MRTRTLPTRPRQLHAAALAVLVVLAGSAPAWADHGAGARGAMNPWLEALLWGVVGLAVAMTVALLVTVFTRAATGHKKDGPRPR